MEQSTTPGPTLYPRTEQVKLPALSELKLQVLSPPASLEKQILSQLAGAFTDSRQEGTERGVSC